MLQLLEMPYVGEEASMLIVLPNEIEGLDGVLSKLASGFDLMSEIGKMYRTKVQVTIPKFKIETEIDLTEVLPKVCILFNYVLVSASAFVRINRRFLYSVPLGIYAYPHLVLLYSPFRRRPRSCSFGCALSLSQSLSNRRVLYIHDI